MKNVDETVKIPRYKPELDIIERDLDSYHASFRTINKYKREGWVMPKEMIVANTINVEWKDSWGGHTGMWLLAMHSIRLWLGGNDALKARYLPVIDYLVDKEQSGSTPFPFFSPVGVPDPFPDYGAISEPTLKKMLEHAIIMFKQCAALESDTLDSDIVAHDAPKEDEEIMPEFKWDPYTKTPTLTTAPVGYGQDDCAEGQKTYAEWYDYFKDTFKGRYTVAELHNMYDAYLEADDG